MGRLQDIQIINRLLEGAGGFEVRAVRIFCEKILNLEEGGANEDADREANCGDRPTSAADG